MAIATLDGAIIAYLNSVPAVTAITGGRIYSGRSPEGGGYPFLTYALVIDDPVSSLNGLNGLMQASIQIDAWGKRKQDVSQLIATLRKAMATRRDPVSLALSGFTGTWAGLAVSSCIDMGFRDLPRADSVTAGDDGAFHSICEFDVWYIS